MQKRTKGTKKSLFSTNQPKIPLFYGFTKKQNKQIRLKTIKKVFFLHLYFAKATKIKKIYNIYTNGKKTKPMCLLQDSKKNVGRMTQKNRRRRETV